MHHLHVNVVAGCWPKFTEVSKQDRGRQEGAEQSLRRQLGNASTTNICSALLVFERTEVLKQKASAVLDAGQGGGDLFIQLEPKGVSNRQGRPRGPQETIGLCQILDLLRNSQT